MSKDVKPKNSRHMNTVAELLVTVALGALAVLPLGGLLSNTPMYLIFIIVAVSLVFSMYLQMVFHELGHLIFARLSGYDFLLFRLGSLTFVRCDGKTIIKRTALPGTSGQCLMIPPEGDSSCPYVLYNFGGSLMNLILGAICTPVYFFWPTIPGAILYIFGVVGIFNFLVNWIPMIVGGIPNDGHNCLSCSRSEDARRAFCITLRITGLLYSGVRLKDMDAAWFDISENAGKDSLTASLMFFSATRYMDMGDMDNAQKMYESAISSSGLDDYNRKEALCELLYIACLKIDKAAHNMYTPDLRKYTKATQSATAKRSDYAYALATKSSPARVLAAKSAWESAVKSSCAGTLAELEDELMDLLNRTLSDAA